MVTGQRDERLPQVARRQAAALGAQPAAGAAVVTDGDHRGDVQVQFGYAVTQRPQRRREPVPAAEGDHPGQGHSRPRSRCWALAAMPEWRSREASSSAMATLRCLPPVQPTATVR